MTDLTEFQQRACAIAVIKMLGGKHFSICDLDAIGKTMGRTPQLAGKDYEALRALHCIDWADMGQDLARQAREKCLELLGLPAEIIEHVDQPPNVAQPTSRHRGNKLRLAFWKR